MSSLLSSSIKIYACIKIVFYFYDNEVDMKKKCSFWFVEILFFSSGIMFTMQPEKNKVIENLKMQMQEKRQAYHALSEAEKAQSQDIYIKSMAGLDQQIEQQESIINGRASVTNKWLWNAAAAVGVVGLVGLAAYNFLTTPSVTLPTNPPVNPSAQPNTLPDAKTPIADTPVANTLVLNTPVLNTPVDVQPQNSAKELFQSRVRYKATTAMAAHSAVAGMINIVALPLFSVLSRFLLSTPVLVPLSPVVPALFFGSALFTPLAYYYKGKLPLEMRDISQQPNVIDYVKRLLTEKRFGDRPDLWKY
jgi:hypothetical protein